jgi:hypothetical protein
VALKLVPGARIEMQGPASRVPAKSASGQPSPPPDIVVIDARSEKERRFVPHGHQALVIGVRVLNEREPMHTTWVYCFSSEHGFWRCESTRIRVIWSPEEG